MKQTILILLGFVATVAATYCLVLYGPDKSLYQKVERIDAEQQKKVVAMEFEMLDLSSDLKSLQREHEAYVRYSDSVLLVERGFRKVHEKKLDSLIHARNIKAPKRLPLK